MYFVSNAKSNILTIAMSDMILNSKLVTLLKDKLLKYDTSNNFLKMSLNNLKFCCANEWSFIKFIEKSLVFNSLLFDSINNLYTYKM